MLSERFMTGNEAPEASVEALFSEADTPPTASDGEASNRLPMLFPTNLYFTREVEANTPKGLSWSQLSTSL
jgi:allantoicase